MAAFTGGGGTGVPTDGGGDGFAVVEQWPETNAGAAPATAAANAFDLNRLAPAQARYFAALKEKYSAVKAGVPLANARDVGGWMGASILPEDMPAKLAELDTLLEERGRKRSDIKLLVMPNQRPEADLFPRYQELGVQQVVHLLPLKHIDDVKARLDRIVQMAFS